MWYLDDGILVGDPDKIGHALLFLETELRKKGLQINRKKCVLWGPAAHAVPHAEGIPQTPWTPGEGITVLGTPIPFPGSQQYVDDHWDRTLNTVENTAATLTSLANKQMAHHLLRHCLDGCKVNHLLRSTDCYTNAEHAQKADEVILTAFEDIIGTALTDTQRIQASMPFSAGGCGIKCPTKARPAARVSALLAFLGSGCHSVGVPEYAHTVPSTWIHPVLEL